MKRISLLKYVLLLSSICFFIIVYPPIENAPSYKIPKKNRIDLAMKQEKLMVANPLTGVVDRSSLIAAYQTTSSTRVSMTNLVWQERGPNNVAGRVRAMLIDKADASHKRVLAAGVSGGLWISNDIEAVDPNWTQVDDFLGNLSICAIAQDPSNPSTLYFGTGEGYFEEKATPGAGIWKSTNGGISWNHLLSTTNYQYINDLVVLSNGHLLASTEKGLIKSTNQGLSWTVVLNTQNGASSNLANDLKVSSDGSIYVSFGIFSQGEIFKSSNQGTSWQKISAAITTTNTRRIELGISAANANTLYALISDDTGVCTGIYRSTNAGLSWTQVNLPSALGMSNFARTQAWYNLAIGVSPSNANHLVVGGIDLHLSTDGGSSWKQISHWSGLGGKDYVHADQHVISFHPSQQGKIMVANDGGIYTCNNINAQKPLFTAKNNGLNITQFYAAAAHPTAGSDCILAGAQDNGTQKFDKAGVNTTTEVVGGDGAYCYIDANQPHIQIASYVGNNYFVSINGGNSFTPVSLNNDGFFANPSYYDDVKNIFYASTKAGKILRWANPQNKSTSYQEISIIGMSGQRITKIVPSTTQPDKLFLGTDDGDVFVINQAHQLSQFSGVKIREASNQYISDIAVHPSDDEQLIIAYSNYGVNHLYQTFNNGITWNSIDGNLPDIPVRTLLYHPDDAQKLIIGTDLGVWMTDQILGLSTIWNQEINGLANVRVDMLKIRTSDKLLLAATHGRGLFTSKSLQSLSGSLAETTKTIVEKSITYETGNCARGYRDISFDLDLSGAVVSSAVVNISIQGGSASQWTDYELLTPSITISPGQTSSSFELRVFDDAIKENPEDIILKVTSSTIDFGTEDQITLTIQDNDADPMAGSGGQITLGSGSSTVNKYPLSAYYEDEKTQFLIRGTELQNQGMQAGPISSLSFEVKEKKSDIPFTSFTIKSLSHTINSFGLANDPFYTTTSTHFSGDYTTQVGWNEINFTNPIQWDGSSNIILEFCYNNNAWSDSDVISSSDVGFSAVKYKRVDAAVGCNLTSSNTISSLRPNLKFGMSATLTLSDQPMTMSTSMDPNAELHVYDDQNELVLSIKNLSATAVSCMDIGIDHYGTAVAPASWIGANSHVSEKQFYIDSDQDFQYEITLYYSQDELNGFVNSVDQLHLVKTSLQIDQMGSGDSYVSVAPTNITRQNLAGGITAFSATFNQFSGFALYENRLGTVPVELIDFDGLSYDDYHELIWITAQEQQLDQYFLERSFDGNNFSAIGSLPAENRKQEHVYRYIDEELPADKSQYFYRLGMQDLDGATRYSDIILLEREQQESKDISIAPNPFTDITSVTLPYELTTYHLLHIIDIHGRIVRDLLENPTGNYELSIKGLDAGTYFLQYIDQEGNTGSRQLISTK